MALNKDSVLPLPVESQFTPVKVLVWGAVSSKGPYFFTEMGGISVLILIVILATAYFDAQRSSKKRLLSRAYFMKDGAPVQTATKSREVLKSIFGDNYIGKHLRVSWPPYSPDLTPAGFWMQPTPKPIIFLGRKKPLSSV